jgi:hypothetical protein
MRFEIAYQAILSDARSAVGDEWWDTLAAASGGVAAGIVHAEHASTDVWGLAKGEAGFAKTTKGRE